MRNPDLVEVELGLALALVVVTSLEVAVGAVQLKGIECLERLAVDADRQNVLLVANLVGETLALGDVVNLGSLLAAGTALLNTHAEATVGCVVKLGDGLVRDGVVDVNLSNTNLTVVLDSLDVAKEPVDRTEGAPFGRAVFAKLGAAVLAVGRGDAL